MNKKAFSTVELIVSFALTMTIAVILFQVVISLRNLYVNNGIKTLLLNKQALITNKMNDTFINKDIYTITKCGSNCINIVYIDGTNDKLYIDKNNNVIEFGSYRTDLPEGSTFGSILIDTYVTPVFNKEKNDSFLIINIPIKNKDIKQEYSINVLYQFNSLTSNIKDVIFSEDYNEYGYVILTGGDETNIASNTNFVEPGFTIYDNEGKVIEANDTTIKIDNPFTTMSFPYAPGIYEVKYHLYDINGNIISTKTRKVKVYPILSNLVADNSMENGGWSVCDFTTEFAKYGEKSCKLTGTTSISESVTTNITPILLDNSHIYYARVEGYQTALAGGSVQIFWPIAEPSMGNLAIKPAGSWQIYSYRIQRNSFTNGSYPVRLDYNNNTQSGIMYYDGIILIDLTATFGSGKEPSKDWCDQNIPYFDTTFKLEILP